jgi:hypothetical protein
MKTVLYSSSRDMGYLYRGTADSAVSICHGKMTEDDAMRCNTTQHDATRRLDRELPVLPNHGT